MLVLPHMGLVKWDSINDYFSHVQLAANMEAIDNHDHTSGKGVQIPYGGLAEQSVGPENLRSVVSPVRWYTPKIIVTEESRENVAYGLLTTPDEVPGVVVPAGGLMLIGYEAFWKNSVENAGRAAIFIGSNQLKTGISGSGLGPYIEAAPGGVAGGTFATLISCPVGLAWVNTIGETAVTTGQTMGFLSKTEFSVAEINGTEYRFPGAQSVVDGLCHVKGLEAGTYNVSVQYKASSGKVTAKRRKLWVAVLGA